MIIIKIIDFLCSLTLVISIYICGIKPRIGWFIYFINAFFYCFLMFNKGLFWMGISGIILGIIGLKNFIKAK
jgi:hypothetical protein